MIKLTTKLENALINAMVDIWGYEEDSAHELMELESDQILEYMVSNGITCAYEAIDTICLY